MKAKPGDRVRVFTADETVEGMLMPAPELELNVLVLKLDSGYNVGFDKKKIKKIEVAVAAKEGKEKKIAAAKQSAKLPTISILHTGGTIASKVDYRTGGVVAKFSAEELLQLFPELKGIANIESRQIMQMQSEMMRLAHYNIMAREIEKEVKKGVRGIIVTHGTDTLHYSAAALAFALEGLSVPVILVGAQRSSDRGSSDAYLNLVSAAYFIAQSDFAGVAICMHENISDSSCLILPATKSRKMHTSRRDAFRPINTTAIARVDYPGKNVSVIDKNHQRRGTSAVKPKLFNDKIKVGLVKAHPAMYASELLAYRGFDGLVIEGTGLGHIPNEKLDEHTGEHAKITEALRGLTSSGIIVVLAPQTIYGRLQLNVYTPQREIAALGVLGHLSDMTPETTFIKLAWLLSNYSREETKKLITKNLRGEITERTEKETFLV